MTLKRRTVLQGMLGASALVAAPAVLRAQAEGRLGAARVIGVYCDIPTAPMLALGPKYGVPAHYLDPGPFKTKFSPEQETFWARTLANDGVDLIVLAGFMRVVKAPLLEPFAGRIIGRNLTRGEVVETTEKLFVVADLSEVWVRANIPEKDIPFVHAVHATGGRQAEVRINAYPDKLFEGRVSFLYPTVTSETRTARIRVELANGGQLLKPEMYAK